jgi:dynein heavy chain
LADKLKVDVKEIKPGNHHEEYNFNKLLEKGIMNHSDFIVELGEKASKEFDIEKTLHSMKEQWETIEFEMKNHKGISNIIKGYDDI